MRQIKIGDIFRKNYVDHERYFLAIEDQFGLYCECIDMQRGERETVKIPMKSSAVLLEILT